MYAVAIDGPAGAGKSTISRVAAQKLGFLYVDTGALYRAVAYDILQNGIDPNDSCAVCKRLDSITVGFGYENDNQQIYLNGNNITEKIRTPQVSAAASTVSAIPEVRRFLFSQQQDIARENNIIMDGRDIGTVVLPNAQVKIFLTASPEERAKRRYEELTQKGEKVSYEKVLQDMIARDRQDTERAIAPLRPAPDAVKLDTSGNTIEQSIAEILAIVRRKLG